MQGECWLNVSCHLLDKFFWNVFVNLFVLLFVQYLQGFSCIEKLSASVKFVYAAVCDPKHTCNIVVEKL